MGYFGVPGADPDLTACASGRTFSTPSSTATRQSFVWDLFWLPILSLPCDGRGAAGDWWLSLLVNPVLQ